MPRANHVKANTEPIKKNSSEPLTDFASLKITIKPQIESGHHPHGGSENPTISPDASAITRRESFVFRNVVMVIDMGLRFAAKLQVD